MKPFGRRRFVQLATASLVAGPVSGHASQNSVGMTLVTVPAGEFLMGQAVGGDADERPVHRVVMQQPFLMSSTEVTNAQYERFAPEHRRYRGLCGVSREDDEPVVFVSWHEAVAFCAWLSDREGKPYRLPTEAEWEYACRAGTNGPFWTGRVLPEIHHRNQPVEGDWETLGTRADDDLRKKKGTVAVDLAAGKMPPNAWGLRAMHGNVEEWCQDWYGAYLESEQHDPVGPADGVFRVCRGGSHNTYTRFLRSANRMAALPEDRHWMLGFRVVQAAMPETKPLSAVRPTMDDLSVKTSTVHWPEPVPDPVFREPMVFVRPDVTEPLLAGLPHHHHPTITWCENGDLLALWFNTRSEIGREMTVVSSRLRYGQSEWEMARLFFKAADRNMTGSCVFHDGKGRLYLLNGVSESTHHKDQCLTVSVSDDSGRMWSRPRIVSNPYDRRKYSPMDSAFVARDGAIVCAMDTNEWGSEKNETGGTIVFSRDRGQSWVEQSTDRGAAQVRDGGTGKLTAGFHLSVVELEDGRLLSFSRTGDIDGRMTRNLSEDFGRTWRYSASPFPGLGGGQRLVLMRMREGPLLLVSFTDRQRKKGLEFADGQGGSYTGYGMFAALSFDEGETWPERKLLTAGGPAREMDGGGNTRSFLADDFHAEPAGYLAATQTPDGMVHLLSSRWHYRFNLAWLREKATPGSRRTA